MVRIILWIVGGLLLLVALAWGGARLAGPTQEQREALALLQQPWEPPGSNAFDAAWLLSYPVPEERMAAITDRDMLAISAAPPTDTEGHGGIVDFKSAAAAEYPDQEPSSGDRDLFCQTREQGCLARVRADLPAYRALIERNAALLGRVAALERYDHFRSRLPPRLDAPMPSFFYGRYSMTRHALAFAEGNIDAALDGTCREFATWRRLGANGDSLIMSMIGIAYSTDGAGRLLADMLQELPAEHPLPVSCSIALKPAESSELSICQAMRGEFAMLEDTFRAIAESRDATNSVFGNLMVSVAFDADATIAESAPAYSTYCRTMADEQIGRDHAFHLLPPRKRGVLESLDCVVNAVGCTLLSISAGDMSPYQNRMLDHGMRLKVLGTLLWLRDHADDPRPLAERIAARPEALKSPARDIEIGKGGKTLRIRQYDTSNDRGRYWEIPLPEELVDASSD